MKKTILMCVAVLAFVVYAFPSTAEFLEDTVCGVSTGFVPPRDEDVTRHTCIVEGSSVFDKWVHGLAFAWVDASSERVFQVLTDYKRWRRNVCYVERVKVTSESENYRIVEWKVTNDLGPPTRYTNQYFLSPNSEPKKIIFDYVGPGDIDDMEGEWVVFSNPSLVNQVLVRYTLRLNPTVIFTDIVKEFVHKNLECLLTDLRSLAEEDSSAIVKY